MKSRNKQIIVVGDRILLRPDTGGKKSAGGLYLPPSVTEKQEVRGGIVVEVGPGIPLGNPEDDPEPWSQQETAPRYIPLQAEVGDYALYLNKVAVPISVEGIDYVIVPQNAILVLIRDELELNQ
ncbi:MAG: co-chaperone GroES [Candidatus Neomarinimicrobiota bacterium]|nr:MAG: co-chaperone GroES [Candidatus Neomarinimicrobiota bacterium]